MESVLAFPGRPPAGGQRRAERIDLSLVIPAYNEARRLPQTLHRVAAWVGSLPWRTEVVVVDDGSGDGTAMAAAAHPCDCGVIRLLRNSGKGAAVRAGMLAARGRVVAFTDADLPYRMDSLEQAFATIERGAADVVFGGRDLRGSSMAVRRSARRNLASASFRMVTRLLVSRQVGDTQCGLKAFSREAAQEIFPRVHTDGFAFDAEAILVARRLGLVADRVPVVLVNEAGSTVSLRRHAPQMLRDILRANLRHARGAGPKSAAPPPYEVLRTAVVAEPVRRAA